MVYLVIGLVTWTALFIASLKSSASVRWLAGGHAILIICVWPLVWALLLKEVTVIFNESIKTRVARK